MKNKMSHAEIKEFLIKARANHEYSRSGFGSGDRTLDSISASNLADAIKNNPQLNKEIETEVKLAEKHVQVYGNLPEYSLIKSWRKKGVRIDSPEEDNRQNSNFTSTKWGY